MPYVNIRITNDGATKAQKLELIQGVTDVLQRVLNKDPARIFIVIDEVDIDNWGVNKQSVALMREAQEKQQA